MAITYTKNIIRNCRTNICINTNKFKIPFPVKLYFSENVENEYMHRIKQSEIFNSHINEKKKYRKNVNNNHIDISSRII